MNLFKKNNSNEIVNTDKYELMASIKVTDVKGYLQDEFNRAELREEVIKTLEEQIDELEKVKIKYDALLVIQEKTKERTERLDEDILDLKTKLKNKNEDLKISNAKQVDIKINAENKLKEKDLIISTLKKEIKSLTPSKKKKGE